MPTRVTVYPGRARSEARAISTDQRIDIANEAALEARATAPVLTGEYRDGISVEVDGDRVFLVDNDEDAVFKEYGTVDTPPHAVLTTAASEHGRYSGWRPR
ncbi:HK97 gp10 family phage protein [Rhodococcus sp. NPDC127528]|uniref:HK97 gp10 family phage protein n=1 Tax=unclassified Rhodococcus (in: high G+C Gram-positive bacteria) TaxID=192944 RepID=UPI00363DD1D0